MRPAEVDLLVGDAAKAGRELGWEPMVDFQQLVEMMVDADLQSLRAGENNILTDTRSGGWANDGQNQIWNGWLARPNRGGLHV